MGLVDLFEGRHQLYVHDFVWPGRAGHRVPELHCRGRPHVQRPAFPSLHERDVSFAAISRAPWSKLEAYRAQRGWTFPFFSSHGSEFNYDFHVTLDESKAPIEYDYRPKEELLDVGFPAGALRGDWPGASVFLRDGDTVHHTYSAYARGLDGLASPYQFLDLTVYGRATAVRSLGRTIPRGGLRPSPQVRGATSSVACAIRLIDRTTNTAAE